ncbi:MAG: hypothetical protein RR346_12080, partial [Bacteroidales bacterium]
LPAIKIKKGKVHIQNDLKTYSAIYQIDGKGNTGKTAHWNLYKGPISLQKGEVLTIRLERIGYIPSKVITYSF